MAETKIKVVFYFLYFKYEGLIFLSSFPSVSTNNLRHISVEYNHSWNANVWDHSFLVSLELVFFSFSTWSFILEKAIFLMWTLLIKSGIHIFSITTFLGAYLGTLFAKLNTQGSFSTLVLIFFCLSTNRQQSVLNMEKITSRQNSSVNM